MVRFSGRLAVVGVVAVVLATAWLVPAGASDRSRPPTTERAGALKERARAAEQRLVDAKQDVGLDEAGDLGPMPWTSYGRVRTAAELARWQHLAARLDDAEYRPDSPVAFDTEVSVVESEAPGEQGGNDTPASGDPVDGVGTGPGDVGMARVSGSLVGPPPPELPPPGGESVEDDGAIPLANPTGLVAGEPLVFTGTIGDGPHGNTTGDFDYYALGPLVAGQIVLVDVENAGLSLPVDTVVQLYDGNGVLVAENDDEAFDFDSYLAVEVDADGDYFVAVAGFPSVPFDPFDPGSGSGPGEVGQYRVVLGIDVEGVEPVPPLPDPFSLEDDGSIPLANQTALVAGSEQLFFGDLGDGPHGETTGDMDFWALGALAAGDQVQILTDTSFFVGPTDTLVRLYDGAGTLIAEDDDGGSGTDSLLDVAVPADGEYYAMVSGAPTVPADPFDPASGSGPGSAGPYDLYLLVGGVSAPELDTVEDDGSIPLANLVVIPADGTALFSGVIGDGPFGNTTGDVDFFALGEVEAGRTILVDTLALDFELDTLVAVYDSTGALIGSNDDDGVSFDSRLLVAAPATGQYYAAVAACCGLPADPLDSGSGAGAASTGAYEVELGTTDEVAPVEDVDVFVFDLAPGDAVSAGFIGAAETVAVVDPAGTVAQESAFNLSFVYPGSSPLRHTGDIGVDHVASTAGAHAVVVRGGAGGDYQGEIRVVRSGRADQQVGDQQVLYLDFDGAELDTTVFGPFLGRSSATLSPMSAFLWRWGLAPGDEDAVIDAVIATVEENLSADLRVGATNGDRDATGQHGELDVLILNSRDHSDRWGDDDVSRVVVGGTIAESAVETIGIAESIDPGNLDSTETAVVLLDVLSSGFPLDPTLNAFPIDPSSTKVDLVGVGVGNVVAHEAGHLLGSWHTELFDEVPSIMDPGGNLAALVGVGPDLVFGTADDVDVDFSVDRYDGFEGLFGDEDTVNRTAFGLSTGTVVP